MTRTTADKRGRSFPLGATVYPEGVNFSVFSKGSTGADLLLFDRPEDPRPTHVIELDPHANRTYHYWHTFAPGVRPGQLYAYRVRGGASPSQSYAPGSVTTLLMADAALSPGLRAASRS